jgi:UDPglucose--hexose-1-phosphate uridylyltransferase
MVDAGEHAVVYSPFWAGSPYEMLVVPRMHDTHLHTATPDALEGVGKAIRDGLAALRQERGEVAYNVVFHAAPYRATAPFHWHAHILPKMTTRAGFELGTGVYINVIGPEQAADELRAGLAKVRAS